MINDHPSILGWECLNTIHCFYRALDAGRYNDLCDQVAADGVWDRQGERLIGHSAIFQALQKRAEGLVTVHLVSNAVVQGQSSERASASYYVSVYHSVLSERASTSTPPVPPPRAVQLATDELVCSAGRWLIAAKSARAIFRSEAH